MQVSIIEVGKLNLKELFIKWGVCLNLAIYLTLNK